MRLSKVAAESTFRRFKRSRSETVISVIVTKDATLFNSKTLKKWAHLTIKFGIVNTSLSKTKRSLNVFKVSTITFLISLSVDFFWIKSTYRPSSHKSLVETFMRLSNRVRISQANFRVLIVWVLRLLTLRKDTKNGVKIWERQDSNLRGF